MQKWRRMGGRMRKHEQLLESVSETKTAYGEAVFWWMGQHSFILKLGDRIVYIDPYLSPNPARRTPPLLLPSETAHADLILCTHDHTDHIDPGSMPGIAKAASDAVFVAPKTARQRMLDLGVNEKRLVSLNAEDVYEGGWIRVTAVKGKHEFFDHDPLLGYPYLGYVIEANGAALYHAGDTIVYEGLVSTLQAWDFDAVFLPINGRDARRLKAGCLGNMTFQEAVDLAGDLSTRWAVPTHYEMFEGNSANPQDFTDYLSAKYPQIRTWVGEAGEPVTIPSQHSETNNA